MIPRLLRLVAALLLATQAWAHPSHTSFAEIGWSADGDALEVALRVIPEDVEELLSSRQQRQVVLVDTPEVRQWLEAWLNEEFRVYADGPSLPVQLQSLDLESYRASWLFFTVAAPKANTLSLQNRLLLSHNTHERGRVQINTVQRLWQPASDRMTFTDEQPQPLWAPAP
ncbi:hypothetical protein BST95_16560 [Halioglobus japonicus]|uniref:Uncharacterized protein n=1 Tax=Halioglobus japonicus TaxID=930805 RepID=A0AAP8MG99_9GAMM|nr:DUF6702 family protein [Halioglobus japonicus]AQA19607.1 hypothetical protein BST95_16560 [Halioglobus japonicus]PLW87323.1 hypothetical protein C0029_01640 [Halioglobus japonicus]GHD09008.1 hypothetical protein GCM10007052_06690 [Halioglobus japonicus]